MDSPTNQNKQLTPLFITLHSYQIICPVRIIHCADDIAYPLELAEELEQELRDAGVERVDLKQVSGPHLLS